LAHVGLLAHLSKLSAVPGLSPDKIGGDFLNDEEIEGYSTLKKELKSFLESSFLKEECVLSKPRVQLSLVL
jgi:hypothetical protein